jgi:hypothetical protein
LKEGAKLDAVIGLLGFVGFIVFLVLVIVASVKKKKRKPYLIGMAACVALFIVAISLPSDPAGASSSAAGVSEKAAVSSEETAEKEAQTMLDNAKKSFNNGNYERALSNCSDIKGKYSDTSVAKGIDQFIEKQYEQYPNLTAEELCKEYDANEVKADDTYKGKPIVVTGKIGDIGKTDVMDTIYVLLDDEKNYSFVSVQCEFPDSQSDAVANLEIGSQVKIIGTCEGEGDVIENVILTGCIVI